MLSLFSKLKKQVFVIAGPCVIENELMVLKLAESLSKICKEFGFFYIFKASFDKANRTSINSFRGLGIEEGLRILEKVKKEFEIPVLTDIHEVYQAKPVSEVVDILQIPAFLCRQTDLLLAAGKTQKIVNIKKGQFLSGKEMKFPIEKVQTTGNEKIMLTERGNFYGYNDLVVDFRNIVDMQEFGFPVVMDVTHSLQSKKDLSEKYFLAISSASASIGCNGFFFEVHENPGKALSDFQTMIAPELFFNYLERIKAIKSLELTN
ncbi:3-deoxy-8-phosphooctulonate synthase [bacterium]|nr:3-deoxy-8-phosphooctulonate synthase [bacterium]